MSTPILPVTHLRISILGILFNMHCHASTRHWHLFPDRDLHFQSSFKILKNWLRLVRALLSCEHTYCTDHLFLDSRTDSCICHAYVIRRRHLFSNRESHIQSSFINRINILTVGCNCYCVSLNCVSLTFSAFPLP